MYRATLKHDLIPPSHLTPKRQSRSPAVPLTPAILQPPPVVPTNAVAIKILHPRVDKTIRRDLRIMSFFAHALTWVPGVQWLSLPEEVEVFGQMMHGQLDLRNEGRNLETFDKTFAARRLPVIFPRPLQTWSTQDVLVEEYQNALSMELFLKNGAGPYNDILAEIGLDAFLVGFAFNLGCELCAHVYFRICYYWTTSCILTFIQGTSWSNFLSLYPQAYFLGMHSRPSSRQKAKQCPPTNQIIIQ